MLTTFGWSANGLSRRDKSQRRINFFVSCFRLARAELEINIDVTPISGNPLFCITLIARVVELHYGIRPQATPSERSINRRMMFALLSRVNFGRSVFFLILLRRGTDDPFRN